MIRLSTSTSRSKEVNCCVWNSYNLICKNGNIGNKSSLDLFFERHISSVTNFHFSNRSEHSSKSIFHKFRKIQQSPFCNKFVSQKRQFSLQSAIESIAKTQSGIFKSLSESTPVEYCQKYLLIVHDLTGLPWWASIVCSTILVRAAFTLPLAVYQQYILAKLENLKLDMPDLVKELKRETAIAVKLYKWDERTARATYNRSLRKEWNKLIVRDNCHPLKASLLLWFQIPLWISMSVSFRNLVYMLPVQDINAHMIFTELTVGGFGFIPNLTIPDSSWIFPVSLGIINLFIVELQMLTKQPSLHQTKLQTFFINAFRTFSILLIPISASVPSCLVLYWTTSSTYGLLQNLALLSPKVKRFFGIPETVIEVKQPYQMVVYNLKTKLKLV